MKHVIRRLLAGAVVAVGLGGAAGATECIAPANPGGGWDFTCRTVSKIMYDLGIVSEPIQVTNMAGAGGGLAFAHVVNERNDDEDLFVAASSATATRLAQGAYGNMTADMVRWPAALGADPGVLAVAADSPWTSLADMVAAVKADPSAVTFAGGSAAGGFDHLKVLMVLRRAGFDDIRAVKYISLDGGADALTQVVGGHAQVMTGDMSEVVGFLKAGRIRVLAVLNENRVPGFDDIPTAREQGFDVVAVNWRGFYLPGGISDAAYGRWVERFRKVAESDAWAEAMAANGLAPFPKFGAEFESWVRENIAEIRALSREIGVIQ